MFSWKQTTSQQPPPPNPSPPYTMETFKNAAASFFQSTTGQSPRVNSYYNSLSPSFLARPITPTNISEFVRGENHAVLSASTPATRQDLIAIAMTPFRGVAAHLVAQNVVVGREGFFANNEYAREALSGAISGTF
jgi:hypothetical protein